MRTTVQARAQQALARSLAAVLPDGALDENSRTELLSQSLVEGISEERLEQVIAQISQGDGGELLERDGRRPKLHSAYSTAALAVNAFAPWLGHEQDLTLAGMNGFETIRFEEKLPIGVRGKTPNLDLVVSGPDALVAVESKCTEHLTGHVASFSEVYDARVADLAEGAWQAEFEALKLDSARYTYLNAAQLVKHYLGLRNTHRDRRSALLYLYWEPTNPGSHDEVRAHREEVDHFRDAVGGSSVAFEGQSYSGLWSHWAESASAEWLTEHVGRLRERYAIAI